MLDPNDSTKDHRDHIAACGVSDGRIVDPGKFNMLLDTWAHSLANPRMFGLETVELAIVLTYRDHDGLIREKRGSSKRCMIPQGSDMLEDDPNDEGL